MRSMIQSINRQRSGVARTVAAKARAMVTGALSGDTTMSQVRPNAKARMGMIARPSPEAQAQILDEAHAAASSACWASTLRTAFSPVGSG